MRGFSGRLGEAPCPSTAPSRRPSRPPPELTSAVRPEGSASGSVGVTTSQLCPGWLRTRSLGSLNWETGRPAVCFWCPGTWLWPSVRLWCPGWLWSPLLFCCGLVFVVSDLKKQPSFFFSGFGAG